MLKVLLMLCMTVAGSHAILDLIGDFLDKIFKGDKKVPRGRAIWQTTPASDGH